MDSEYGLVGDFQDGAAMRLTTSGIPNSALNKGIVATVCREPLPKDDRADRVLVSDKVTADLMGYAGFLTSAKLGAPSQAVPTVSSIVDIDHLRTNDIVAIEPRNGFVRTLYRPDSNHNIIFTTQRCNSNCLMCSQPPQDRDDADASVSRNLELIRLINDPPKRLVITGGANSARMSVRDRNYGSAFTI